MDLGRSQELVPSQEPATVPNIRLEQATDPSLKRWWKWAEQEEKGFYFRDGILYKRKEIQGQEVHQLCLPEVRRDQAFRLAHDNAHLGADKTHYRLKLSFAFPE